jgi:alpha-mannosidase
MTADPSLRVSTTCLENAYYVVELDFLHGGIMRIFDKVRGLELLDTSSHCGNELYCPAGAGFSSATQQAEMELVEQGPVRATTRTRSKIGELPFECLTSIYAGLPRIDFSLSIDYGKGFEFGKRRLSLDVPRFPDMTGARVLVEDGTGLSVLFPLAFAGKLLINRPFGIYETKKADQFSLDFADVCAPEHGFCLIHRNSPGCSYADGVLALTLSQGRPLVVGRQNYQYSVYSHGPDPGHVEAFRAAQNRNTPFEARLPALQSGTLRTAASFLTVDHDNIVLSALYAERDTVFVRLFEMAGVATRATVAMPWIGAAECSKVRLDGEDPRPQEFANGAMVLDFNPWEIVTIACKRPAAAQPR